MTTRPIEPQSLSLSRAPKRRNQAGFTLLELMIVVAVLGILAAQASYSGSKQQRLAKRTELTLAFDAIRDAQRAHYLANKRFAGTFEELTFSVDRGRLLTPTRLTAGRYEYTLSQPWGEQSYYVLAVGELDQDAFPDIHILEAGRR